MKLELKKVNIAKNEDYIELKEKFYEYFDQEIPFEPIKEKLSNLNIVSGFGRGFWAGVHGYFYVVYHKENDKFYWYLQNIESDEDVYFYELRDDAYILKLLQSKPIEKNFYDYDAAANYGDLYPLSVGKKDKIPEYLKEVSLEELFREDTEELRVALMEFRPATQGTKYPHREFDIQYSLPAYKNQLDDQVKKYNQSEYTIFRKGEQLYIDLDGDVFKLEKTKK